MDFVADMRKDLKRSIIILVSLMAFETIINAEDDEDDAALSKINNLLARFPRTASNDNELPTLKDSNTKRELESKLSDLLEFGRGATKWPVVREYVDDDETTRVPPSEVSPFMRFDPADKDEEEAQEESVEYTSEETVAQQNTPKHPAKHENKHQELVKKIRKKLTDKETKLTVSLPVAIVIVGSIILVTCCCSLYLRNRLVACIDTVTGRKKKRSKILAVDSERGRVTPRIRKKSVTSNKKRARSLSQDIVNVATQKSSTVATAKDVEEESTTGCYRCCKKKNKREKKSKR